MKIEIPEKIPLYVYLASCLIFVLILTTLFYVKNVKTDCEIVQEENWLYRADYKIPNIIWYVLVLLLGFSTLIHGFTIFNMSYGR